jgi:hypothetical protein
VAGTIPSPGRPRKTRWYGPGKDGAEMKMMEIVYTKK